MDNKVVVLDADILGSVGFASKISTIVFENDLGFGDIFNGLNIASAAFLLDFSSTENGVDKEVLSEAIQRYVKGLENAVQFALTQVEAEGSNLIIEK